MYDFFGRPVYYEAPRRPQPPPRRPQNTYFGSDPYDDDPWFIDPYQNQYLDHERLEQMRRQKELAEHRKREEEIAKRKRENKARKQEEKRLRKLKEEEEKRLKEEQRKKEEEMAKEEERKKWEAHANDPKVQEDSATRIQKIWRGHWIRAAAIFPKLKELKKLEEQFSTLLKKYEELLNKLEHGELLNEELPSAKNIRRLLLTEDEELTRCLLKLDSIPSGRLQFIRDRRKALVNDINRELARIEPFKSKMNEYVRTLEEKEAKLREEEEKKRKEEEEARERENQLQIGEIAEEKPEESKQEKPEEVSPIRIEEVKEETVPVRIETTTEKKEGEVEKEASHEDLKKKISEQESIIKAQQKRIEELERELNLLKSAPKSTPPTPTPSPSSTPASPRTSTVRIPIL